MKIIVKSIKKIEKNYRFVSVSKVLDPDLYILHGSGSKRANNIRIQQDPDPDPQHFFLRILSMKLENSCVYSVWFRRMDFSGVNFL